jgi:uncharacterized glyoxalase superfamily protein PhnB
MADRDDASATKKAKFKMATPQFVVPDLVAAAEYYRDIFGFTIAGYFFEPPMFSIVVRDGVEIQLGQADPGAGPACNFLQRKDGIDAYIWVSDVDALYAELQERSAKIIEPPTGREYGCYELMVEDLNGFRLTFAVDTSVL